MAEDSLKNFVDSVIFLTRVFNGLKDGFFIRRLYFKIYDFTSAYLAFLNKGKGSTEFDVAQYEPGRNLINKVNNLCELLDYIEHSDSSINNPLLISRKKLLELKIKLLNHIKEIKPNAKPAEQNKKRIVSNQTVKKDAEISVDAVENINVLSVNKEKIMDFVKRFKNVRAKDIVDNFDSLSIRTIKRNLKELTDKGYLVRKSENSAVFYSVNNLS